MFDSVSVVGRGRVGSAIAARLRRARRRAPRRSARISCCCACPMRRSGESPPRDRRRPVDRARQRRDATRRARSARPPIQRPSAADLHARPRSRTARRGLGGGHGRRATTPRARGRWLAELLGLLPFDLRDEARGLYHAGAAIASNYLVTLHRAASRLFEAAGAPPEALAAADASNHRQRIPADRARSRAATGRPSTRIWRRFAPHAPDLEAMYRALADVTG